MGEWVVWAAGSNGPAVRNENERTQVYRIALDNYDYEPLPAVYTHICRTHLNGCTVETRHYDEAAAQRERAWREQKGERAEVICKSE